MQKNILCAGTIQSSAVLKTFRLAMLGNYLLSVSMGLWTILMTVNF